MRKADKNLKFWDENFLFKFEQKYDEIKDTIFNQELIDEFKNVEKQWIDEINLYRKNFNKIAFFWIKVGLFFSALLLFIPFYWNWKKYKQFKIKKNEFLEKINDKVQAKLEVHNKVVNYFDFQKFINHFSSIIKYKHMGPISSSLVEEFQSLSLSELNEKNISNSYKTSWGILDEDKIVIHKSKQQHIKYIETYTGSITIYVSSIGADGKRTTRPYVVSATYQHPAFNISDVKYTYTFMESCSNLEFYFDDKSSRFKSKKFNKKNNYAPLENSEFDVKFNWIRNDDLQFRMLFTPYAQEVFLKEINALNKITNSMKWKKEKVFISNEYENSSKELLLLNRNEYVHTIYNSFLNDENVDIEQFTRLIFDLVVNYYKNIFNSTKYVWMTTLLQSEDHKTIIKKINNQNQPNSKDLQFFFHNLLSEIFSEKIISVDTECFNEIENIKYIGKYNNNKLYESTFSGISYEIQEKIIYIPKWSPNGMVNVPVYYKNYVPHYGNLKIFGSILNNGNSNNYYFYEDLISKSKTNINDPKLLNLLHTLSSKARVYLNDNIFALCCKETSHNIYDDVEKLLNLL